MQRQPKICELIQSQPIHSQNELVQKLEQEGIHATQATISRDLQELHVSKIIDGNTYRYALSPSKTDTQCRLAHCMHMWLKTMVTADNLIVLKTDPGCAHVLGVLLDQLDDRDKIGTVCGNDTCLVICRNGKAAGHFLNRILEKY